MIARDGMLTTIAEGLVGGAIATKVMDPITVFMYEHEDPAARRREDEVRAGEHVYDVAARRIDGALGLGLSAEARRRFGWALHWGITLGAGVTYAWLRRRWPAARRLHGAAFGLGFEVLADQVLVTALGLAARPTAYPWQTHARGVVAHVAYGMTIETVLRAVDRLEARAGR